ncbi:MAG: Gfo/Idh/MocA family oxidoreductase [Verrucomicrobiota bacterium]|nr:Gfo/Idh/MocA family oxidoreductase [Verrucomicrobiota bacterium]
MKRFESGTINRRVNPESKSSQTDGFSFNVGVIGATGYIGAPYRAEIREANGGRIVALCARRRELLEAAGKEDGAELLTDKWLEVVRHPDVNFVIVATPDALHHEAVMACAEAGKHLLCEKPVGVNAAEAFEMWATYRDAGLAHYVPFWTRYCEPFVRTREVIESGVLGDIRGVVYRWHNPRPDDMPLTWRDDAGLSSAGSIADVGSHAYDTLRWLLGREATRVQAHADTITPARTDLGAINLTEALGQAGGQVGAPRRKGTTFDYASIAWEFDDGAVATLVLSHTPFFRKGIALELELHGTKASLGLDRVSGNLTLAKPDEPVEIIDTVPANGFGNRFAKYVFPNLRQALAGEETDHPDLKDGWRVQLFTDAAARSARSGRWETVE